MTSEWILPRSAWRVWEVVENCLTWPVSSEVRIRVEVGVSMVEVVGLVEDKKLVLFWL